MKKGLYILACISAFLILLCGCNNQEDTPLVPPPPPEPHPSIEVFGLILNEENESVPFIDVLVYDSAVYYSEENKDKKWIGTLIETGSDARGFYKGGSGLANIANIEKIVFVTRDMQQELYKSSIVTASVIRDSIGGGIVSKNITIYKE